MAKTIPTEQLILLHNKMLALSPRHPERKNLIRSFAEAFGVSESTIRRQLREHVYFVGRARIDKNIPRAISKNDMLLYCQLIAALKIRTSNKKNKHLSTQACIRILEEHGVETENNLIKISPGTLKKSTVNRYLKKWGYDFAAMKIEPTVVHFEAEYSNDCWQFDFTPSDFKQFSAPDGKKLFIVNVTDDKSGSVYFEYALADGEDTLTALRFLFNAMAPKKISSMPFQGIPKMIYTDNGAFSKSTLFKRVLVALGIELKTHLPRGKDGRRTTARAKGKTERTNRSAKEMFEPLFHLHEPTSLEQLNEWAANYIKQSNEMPHRSEKYSRLETWKRFLPQEGYRKMCSWEKFCQIVREPETRIVGSDACVSVNGVLYQLSTDMAGLEVILLHGAFDNELHVEFDDEISGPFYPFKGPIPLLTYRTPTKSHREKQADEIAKLAKNISVPLSIMTGDSADGVVKQLKNAQVIEYEMKSIPFEEKLLEKFQNRFEAKQAISQYLNRPLATLSATQLDYVNQIVGESLEKEAVMNKVKQYFTLVLCKSGEK
ncbi:TPA: transposase family protein [Legionella pneumophila]|nr:transposase family protein [Legionella pneumophila]HAU0349954.1 transposase family protein [Legionella pneumophila]HAU0353445.1 transposase family protein [Legionella pneumophila]HAU0359534.1 transposase family protein [Legionella pneumophila]HAU0368091.1 transposase family protein [Legionella pneumophila]